MDPRQTDHGAVQDPAGKAAAERLAAAQAVLKEPAAAEVAIGLLQLLRQPAVLRELRALRAALRCPEEEDRAEPGQQPRKRSARRKR